MRAEADGGDGRGPLAADSPHDYRERLSTPLWWYPVAVAVSIILAAEFHVTGYALTDSIPFLTLPPLAVIVVWTLGRSRLAITAEELSIRGAHVPLRYISAVVALDPKTLRRLIGREGDPQAFVSIRPWIGPGVQLQLDDPDDPTPYWVISSRRPDRVVALLRAPDPDGS